MHSSYYYRAHACIMVFDVTRKVTYKNLETWCVGEDEGGARGGQQGGRRGAGALSKAGEIEGQRKCYPGYSGCSHYFVSSARSLQEPEDLMQQTLRDWSTLVQFVGMGVQCVGMGVQCVGVGVQYMGVGVQ